MMDEPFARGGSLLHQRDPKVKIVVAILFVAVVAISNNFLVVAAGLLLMLGVLTVAQLDFLAVAKRVLAANSFTLFIWLTLPLTYPGDKLLLFNILPLSKPGINLALLISIKTNAVVLCIIALLATSTVSSLGHGLERLHFPKRLCFLLLFSYRYVFVIYQEYQRLRRAALLRCFTPQTNMHTYKTYGYLFGMTLIKSLNRASRVQQAMVLRGFNNRLIPLRQQATGRLDILFLGCSFIAIGGLIFLHFL